MKDRYRGPRDDWGRIVFRDDYLARPFKFTEQKTGPGSIELSPETAHAKDFSLKIITGANAGDNINIKYVHKDINKQRVGAEIRFASTSDPYFVYLGLDYRDGYKLYTGTLFADSEKGLYIINQNNENVLLHTRGFPLFKNIKAWNWMKLIIDLSTKQYVRAGINGDDKINIIDQNLHAIESDLSGCVISNITVSGPPTGGAATLYIDQYIFTENNTQ